MRLSLSSFLIMMVMATILIVLFHLALTRKKSHIWFRTDFLSIMLAVIFLRILFPIELPFTITLKSTNVMTSIRDIMLFEPITGLSIMKILVILWGIGIMVQEIRYVLRIRRLHFLSAQMKESAEHHLLSAYIPQATQSLYFTDAVSTPMVMGSKNDIYLPKTPYTDKELKYILMHEHQHILHKDLLIKQFINLLVIFYWWFPPIYLLQKQIDLYLEIHADYSVVKNMKQEEYLEYAQTILDVQRKQIEFQQSVPSAFSACFINDSAEILKYRIDFLLKGSPKKRTKSIFLFIAFILPFLSNVIIFEPYYLDAPDEEGVFTKEELEESSYIIRHSDGTYTLVLDGEELPLDALPESLNLPIINE